jgi:hypothetical protein
MPTARPMNGRSRGFAIDPTFIEADFPGLCMAIRQPRGFVVAWEDLKGHTLTTQTLPTVEAAESLLVEILTGDRVATIAGDEKQTRRHAPQRLDLRVIKATE